MRRIQLVIYLIGLSLLLTACSRIKYEILSSLHQGMSQTTNEYSTANWEKDINIRYKWAITNKDMELFKECLEDGADINDVSEISPVFLALTKKNYDMAKYLLDLGTSATWSDNEGYSILHHLTQSYDYNACKMLLDYGADVNHVDGDGRTEIEYATTKVTARFDIFKLLVEYEFKCL